MGGRAMLERRAIHLDDLQAVVEQEYPLVWQVEQERARRHGTAVRMPRSFVALPLLGDDRAIGVLVIQRFEIRPFTISRSRSWNRSQIRR